MIAIPHSQFSIPHSQFFMQRSYSFLFPILPVLLVLGLLAGLRTTAVNAIHAASPATADHLPDWGREQPLTTAANTPFGANRPVIAASASGPTVTVLFNRRMGNSITANDPWFVRSFDNGTSWTAPAAVYSSTLNSVQVDVAYDDSSHTTHAVWREGNGLAYAADRVWGTSSITFLSVPQNAPGINTPAIAAGPSGLLAVVWSEGDGANPDIYLNQSATQGASWQQPRLVKATPSTSLFPDVVVDENDVVHVVWEEHDKTGAPGQPVPGTIYYSHTTPAGWSAPVDLSALAGADDARRPTLLLTNHGLDVAFASESLVNTAVSVRVHQLHCTTQCETALGWLASPPVSGAVSFSSSTEIIPTLAQYQGCSLVYFHGIRSDVAQALESVWGGSQCDNWEPLNRPTPPPGQAIAPQLAYQGSQWAYLAYESVATNNQIAFRRNTFKMFLPFVGCSNRPSNSACQP